ncbi:MAG: cold shock domain-containing protein [Candidatus Hydrothermae bacterium]|jgi:CspA family cold shock protein|nr:cold shock domain-containing protein [Candidatus Hydrothermae bacterium]
MSKLYGHVKWFNARKGYGFITREDGQGEVFVHYSDIVGQFGYRTLEEGQRVEFTVADTPRGPKAQEVRVVEG